jgi:cytochrome c556
MKRLIVACAGVVVAVALVCVLATSGHGQQAPGPRDFMRLKLDHSQKTLEGLALEDYDKMAKHSQELSLLSLAASWQVLQTPEYAQQSLEFRRAADALTAAAKKKNLDGAALAYVDVTMKCVNCHKYVRGVRMAAVEPTEAGLTLEQSLDGTITERFHKAGGTR